MVKSPNEVDRHVGSRVRMRRMLIGMSQEKLGEALGITFQQVQKYEKGTNRVSASRLQQIAGVLGVTVSFFYGDQASQNASAGGFAEQQQGGYTADEPTSEGWKLVRAFQAIEDAKVRRKVVELVQALSRSGLPSATERSE